MIILKLEVFEKIIVHTPNDYETVCPSLNLYIYKFNCSTEEDLDHE